MVLKDRRSDQFSDPAAQPGAVKGGHRALPAVLAVLVAMVASARAAEAFVPMSRTMASEAAAVRMLSEAIVRAVRDLSNEDRTDPAEVPAASGLAQVDQASEDEHAPVEAAEPDGPQLGWQQHSRPPPVE